MWRERYEQHTLAEGHVVSAELGLEVESGARGEDGRTSGWKLKGERVGRSSVFLFLGLSLSRVFLFS